MQDKTTQFGDFQKRIHHKKAALREMIGSKENYVKIKDGMDVNLIMHDMMSIVLEGTLDEEVNEEFGYSKYDYCNKDTDNSWNDHSQKTMHSKIRLRRI